jgi:nitrite reductase (NADH) large subunit
MAGMRTLEELLSRAPDKYDITVFGAEPRLNYNRIMLSPILAGEKEFEEIILNDWDWYEKHDIQLHAGDTVVGVDRHKKIITSARGRSIEYDKLLLATGSEPIIIPVPGHDKEGVITFRDMGDVDTMIAASKKRQNAVVIGGGLLGLEAAYGLSNLGMRVTVVHLAGHLMERQLDPVAGELLKQELGQRDIHVVTEGNTSEILGNGRCEAVKLNDGRTFDADLVVMAVGIKPNAWLAKSHDLAVGRGIQVDDFMKTSDDNIFAIGECIEHRGLCYGLVAPIFDMSKILADTLAGIEVAGYEGSTLSTKLKVSGVDLFSAGEFQGEDDVEEIVFHDEGAGVYKKIVVKDDKVRGAVMYGDTADGGWLFRLMKEETDVADIRDSLIFGEAYAAGGGVSDVDLVASMPDDAEICGCNGVCKGAIVSAIQEKGLGTVDEVKSHTKAGSSCGSCVGLVEQVLASAVGDDYDASANIKTVCKCTVHDHDTVRKAIVEQELKDIPAVYEALDWHTPNGCGSCRPAINYYLLCAWPGEYVDDQQSRFINERAHANIQKDGTYSVIPRMWGGLTNPRELRAIADVADKFDIPTVKVTGGQRIDLLGVKKEDLPAVWDDLNDAGMVSGHAYGKSLRTVKTCVGSEWCRFGTQDSTKMGVDLERMTWGSWTPHKFKMAVSGCPRNCAEATIKDLGVVAVDSGWEMSVGGNGGIHVKATEFLVKVETEQEVKEYAGAFMQIYRENAHYLERTAPWIERVGLDYVKERLIDDPEGRKAAFDRFMFSQQFMQADPWKDRKEDREFAAPKPFGGDDTRVLETV